MPIEKKRLLIILSACGAFVVTILVLLLFVFWPKIPSSPASFGPQSDLRSDPADELVPPILPYEAPDAGNDQDITSYVQSLTDSGESTAIATTTPETAAPAPSTPAIPATGPTSAIPPAASSGSGAKTASTSKPAASTSGTAGSVTKVTVTEYWIQVTSLSSITQAEDFKAFLTRQGIIAVISTGTSFDTTVYRVIIGPYSTYKEATGWLPKFKSIDGCEDSFITEFKAVRTK